ncbi:hypothetical protein FCU45_03030 [Sulfurimonas crateris]|uniref:Uncharacterized protein n=1 Tax=Sulfurimonas crateris TaxID=2574727 RepID=A0A4U2Z7R2_9BACT|nr:hypothetical protein [Sulfurimonas crateris]TKI70279.1 hypothetical protein FCU45_03030 [Sulfurimonas crateris]
MNHQNILSEDTNKIKTKLFVFSGVSLFIGLAEVLPTELSVIGLNFEQNEKILGWFLFSITVFLLIYFSTIASLNVVRYFKDYFISKKVKTLTGDTIGLTYEEIGEMYDREEQYSDDEPRGSLNDEAQDIQRKIKALEERFDKNHLTFYNIIEIIFNYITPIVLAVVSIGYLYCFLTH